MINKDLSTLAFKKATSSQIIDMADYLGVQFVVQGSSAGAVTLTIEHGETDDLSDAAAVPAAELNGTNPVTVVAGALTAGVGYLGNKRYVRASHGSLPVIAILAPRIRGAA